MNEGIHLWEEALRLLEETALRRGHGIDLAYIRNIVAANREAIAQVLWLLRSTEDLERRIVRLERNR